MQEICIYVAIQNRLMKIYADINILNLIFWPSLMVGFPYYPLLFVPYTAPYNAYYITYL